MRNIAIIIRHDYDTWENHNPDYETVIGYLTPWDTVDLDIRAKSYICSMQELYEDKIYKDCLGTKYPYFTYKIITQLDSHIITMDSLTTNSPTFSSKTI